jgi:DNA/RNA-binding protein KIN17
MMHNCCLCLRYAPQIANRIKAKGLNKLRWYCQLCQKSCRDENGFKCHQMSEGHQRQMQVRLCFK